MTPSTLPTNGRCRCDSRCAVSPRCERDHATRAVTNAKRRRARHADLHARDLVRRNGALGAHGRPLVCVCVCVCVCVVVVAVVVVVMVVVVARVRVRVY